MAKNPAAVALGRLGGLATKGITSRKKAAAARRNGKKGGRPKGKRKPHAQAGLEPCPTCSQPVQRMAHGKFIKHFDLRPGQKPGWCAEPAEFK